MRKYFSPVVWSIAVVLVLGAIVYAASAKMTVTLPKDANNKEIQSANRLQFEDGAATPVVSPTILDGDVHTITVPTGAFSFGFKTTDAAVRYGSGSTLSGSGTGNGYAIAPTGTTVHYPVCGVSYVYWKSQGVTTTADFFFEMGD